MFCFDKLKLEERTAFNYKNLVKDYFMLRIMSMACCFSIGSKILSNALRLAPSNGKRYYYLETDKGEWPSAATLLLSLTTEYLKLLPKLSIFIHKGTI